MSILVILLIIIVAVAVFVIVAYNGLVRSRVRVDESFSDITIQLKRRYDLIPNLVNTVKGYATHESQVFADVSTARSAAMGATGIAQKAEAENQLAGTLKSLFAVAEAYPELKANENFLGLQTELTDTEDKIQASRRFYNGNVRDYNTKIMVFPTSILAGMFGFTHRDFFEVENQAVISEPVKVEF
jgi:LemA protein